MPLSGQDGLLHHRMPSGTGMITLTGNDGMAKGQSTGNETSDTISFWNGYRYTSDLLARHAMQTAL